jgi:2-haloacid dehalogenase
VSDRWATFDCYGTLIDWERGLRDAFTRLWTGADADALLARHHEVEPRIQRADPGAAYRDVLARALSEIASSAGLPLRASQRGALGESLPAWPPFPEVAEALRTLRTSGWRLAILSNTDPDLLEGSVARIGVEIDVRITASDAGGYKPAPGHWEAFFERTGAQPQRHIHVGASLYHDIAPAAEMGLRSVWIDREGAGSEVPRTATLPDLRRLPEVLEELVPQAR